MIKTLKIKKAAGQKAIKFLREKKWLSTEHKMGKTQLYLIIPLAKSANEKAIKKQLNGKIEEKNLSKLKKRGGSLKDLLVKVIPKKHIEKVGRSFDVVGDIAILDIPKELTKLEHSIAWTLLRSNKAIKTVSKRASITSGTYRIRKIKTLVGKKTSETTHIENGVKLKLDINKVYFSPRWARERLRIAKQVKPNEKVLVMFAGVGPFSLAINKFQPKVKQIVSVEINKDACEYLKENIRLNCGIYSGKRKPAIALMEEHHKLICGDVKKELPKLKTKFDRTVMPLPKLAIEFLPLAIKQTKKGGIIHLYRFEHEKELAKTKRELVKKYPVKLIKTTQCGTYAPGINRYCFDLKIK